LAELDLCNPDTVIALARRYGLRLTRDLGQHFLIDREVLRAIVGSLETGGEIYEIGTGVGVLTVELSRIASRVLSVEIDENVIRTHRTTLENCDNVEVVKADARVFDPVGHGIRPPFQIAGNIPYGITGTLIEHLLELPSPAISMVLMVQREVAERWMGEGEWGIPTLAVQSLVEIEAICDVGPDAFLPRPKVWSRVVKLIWRPKMELDTRQRVLIVAKEAFKQRRKVLTNSLTPVFGGDNRAAREAVSNAGLDPARRPGTLGLQEWLTLTNEVERWRAKR
jgi:16S rRNA (adenine1518-N6/adenine1519-N6)-dimethyltransferase